MLHAPKLRSIHDQRVNIKVIAPGRGLFCLRMYGAIVQRLHSVKAWFIWCVHYWKKMEFNLKLNNLKLDIFLCVQPLSQ